MKVYVLIQYSGEYSEIIDIFDTLEKAQSYKGRKPEDWATDSHSKRWWDGLGKIHLAIGEWEVK